MTLDSHYKVIVVGGRPAGATLAKRLGQEGIKTLLLERSPMPSIPAASSPVIYAPSMTFLDELGIDECKYARDTPKIHKWIIESAGNFQIERRIPEIHGRDYAYAIDRERFDHELWLAAQRQPCVTACDRVSVIKLCQDGNRVYGVTIKNLDTDEIKDLTADLIIGADGRFSFVAREVGSKIFLQNEILSTSVYYAYWKNVKPKADFEPAIHMISTSGEYGLLVVDSADGSTLIVVEGTPNKLQTEQVNTTSGYQTFLHSHQCLSSRLVEAEMITDVHGMRKIGNLYREAGGSGWALVGDAFHQKDPLDGQGIHDAMLGSKILARAITAFIGGQKSWETVLSEYQKDMYAETYPMFQSTLHRVKREIFAKHPTWFMRTVAQWIYTNEDYMDRWARILLRDVTPSKRTYYRTIGKAVLQGAFLKIKDKFR